MNQYPAAGLASLVAAQGQGPDTTLVHMTEDEVRALQDMARAQGRELPLNPITGLPQAGFLSDFLKSVGRGISTIAQTALQNPQTTALLTGAAYGAIKGDLQKGLEAGMKAYAGTQILGGLTSLGRGTAPAPTPSKTAGEKPSPYGWDMRPEDVLAATKPAVGTVKTTVQQPGGLDAVLRSVLGGGQPGTTQQGQQGMFGGARDPIMEFIKLYALNKASQKMGQDKYMPKPEPVQYRDVRFSRGEVNPRFDEPGQPYFLGGGYADYGTTTEYPGYTQTPTMPQGEQRGQPPPGQPPPNIPRPAQTEPLEFYRAPPTQSGYSMAGGGIVPRPNPAYPMSRVPGNGYEPAVDTYTGEEKFADGGVADTEEERRRKYFEDLRPFAPALTDYYRGTPSTGRESVQGDTFLRETNPLTGLTTGAPSGIADPNLADWYKSLLNPPIGRAPVEMGDYFKTTPYRAQTNYGPVISYPVDTGGKTKTCPDGSVIPVEQECKTGGSKAKCPPGTKNAGMEYDPIDFLTGGDPCGGPVGDCGANEFRNPVSGECECNAGFERGPDGVCKGKGTGGGGTKTCPDGSIIPEDQTCTTGTEPCEDPNAERDSTGTCVCKSGYTLDNTGRCGKGGGKKTKVCPDGSIIPEDQTCTTGTEPCEDPNAERNAAGECVCKSGYKLDANGKCSKGKDEKTPCGDGTYAEDYPNGKCPVDIVKPEDCIKKGLIYDSDRALAGLYPCVPKVTKYKCDDGREVDDPSQCSYDCAPGSVYVKGRGCICTNTDLPPDPEFGCKVKEGGDKVTPEDCFKQGLSYDPVKAAAGLYPCFKEKGEKTPCGDGTFAEDYPDKECPKRDTKCEDPNAERNAAGECVCKSGYKLDANGSCAKSVDDGGEDGDGGGKEKEKCAADETQVGELCFGRCPNGSTYTRGLDGENPCPTGKEDDDKDDKDKDDKDADKYDPRNPNNPFKMLFKQCPDGSYTLIWEGCDGIPDVAAFNKFVNTKGFSIGGRYVDGATALLAAYDTYKNISAGKEGAAAASAYALAGSLAKFGASAGYSSLAGLGPYGVVFAAIAAIGASLVNTQEFGDVALRNYWKAIDQGRGLGQAPPEELAQGFINFYRTNKNNFGGQFAYGRTGNEDFLFDMTQLINQAVDAGYIRPGATADQIYATVVKPWLGTMSSGPDNDAARSVQDFMMTDLIYNYMLGRPISNAQVKNDSKYKIVSQKPIYTGTLPEDMQGLGSGQGTGGGTGGGGRGAFGGGEEGREVEKAAGGLMAVHRKKGKKKRYQTGGIAALNRTRMGAAVNPADGYNFGFAKGGLPSLPEYRAGGKLLRGPGDGMSDDIPAVIRGKGVQRAALADGEFVIPADVVSHLGNGSTEAGAKKLYKMMAQIRAARTGRKKQAPQVNADKYLPRV